MFGIEVRNMITLKRVEGKVRKIDDREEFAVIEVDAPGKQYPINLYANSKEGAVKVKGGNLLAVGDYIIADFVESIYFNKKLNKDVTSKWLEGEIEVSVLGNIKHNDHSQIELTHPVFSEAGQEKPEGCDDVSERVRIFFKFRKEVCAALGREPKGEECAWVSTLFIDYMRGAR
jgi:hypothetical protein